MKLTYIIFIFFLITFSLTDTSYAILKCKKGYCIGNGKVAIFGTEKDGRRDVTSGGQFGSCRNDGNYGEKQDPKDKFVRLNYKNDKKKNLENTPCVAAISTANYKKLGGHKIACKATAEITINEQTYIVRIGDNGTSHGFTIEMSGTCYRTFGIPANNPFAKKIVIRSTGN